MKKKNNKIYQYNFAEKSALSTAMNEKLLRTSFHFVKLPGVEFVQPMVLPVI